MDFKVLPVEKKMQSRLMQSRRQASYGTTYSGTPYQRLYNDDMRSVVTEDNQFYSPMETPEGSDTEEGGPRERRTASTTAPPPTVGNFGQARPLSVCTLTFEENDYVRLA